MSKARLWPALSAFALFVCLAVPHVAAQPAGEADTDWPCVQRKVPSLTPAAIWSGPSLDEAGDWREDDEVARLVERLRQRRVPLEEATKEIERFAEGLDAEAGRTRLTLLFAGLFDRMNAERSDIIAGIERYARRQKAAAEEIRDEAARLDEAGDAAIDEAREKLRWDQRVFDERRRSLPYICEAPRLVEQRLFALGRAIGQAMPK